MRLVGGLLLCAAAGAQTQRPASNPIQFHAITILPAGSAGISCSFSGAGEVSLAYSSTCSASGGTAPYSWSTSGQLPPGVTLNNATGAQTAIAGIPTTAGTYSFTVKVTDSSPAAPQSASSSAQVQILPAPSVTGPRVLPAGAEGTVYSSQTFTATGGSGGYTWSASGLPNGLGISAAGILSGTPATGSAGNYSPTFTVRDSNNIGASLQLGLVIGTNTLTITVDTSPTGLPIFVDSVALTAPQTVSWVPGTNHTIGVNTPLGSGTTRSVFTNWSDGGASVHTVVASANTLAYTANFKTQYSLTVSVSPSNSGTVTAAPAAGDTFYDSGTSVQLTASPSSGFLFQNWTGALTGSTNPASVSMSAPRSVTANFVAASTGETVTTIPAGLVIVVDGVSAVAPQTFNWVPGSNHTLALNSPQGSSGGARQVFQSWSDGGGQTHTVVAPSTATTYTATFKTQYQLTTTVLPAGGGTVTVSPSSVDGFYDVGSSLQLTATPAAGNQFQAWSGDLAGTVNPQPLVMNAPRSITANFQTPTNQLTIQTLTVPDGIVGVTYPATPLVAQGGSVPYSWSATGVPSGLTFSSGGVLSGTPGSNASGAFQMVVTVTDSSAPPLTASRTYDGNITTGTNILTVFPEALAFGGDPTTKPPQQSIGVFTSQSGTGFTAVASTTNGAPWLKIPSTFSQSTPTPATIVVTVDPTGMLPGTYTGQVQVSSVSTTPTTATVSVTLTVTPVTSAQLAVANNAKTFALTQGGQAAQGTVTVTNVGGGTLQFSSQATSDGGWLAVIGPGAGTATPSAPGSVAFTVNPAGVSIGVHRGKITVKDTVLGNTVDANVTLLVNGVQPTLQLSQQGFTYAAVTGAPAPPTQALTVLNLGQGSMPWTAQGQTVVTGQTWLQVGSQSGSSTPLVPSQATAPVSQAGLAVGNYYGSLNVAAPTAANSPQSAGVLLKVVSPGQLGSGPNTSTGGVILAGVAGGTTTAQQDVALSNPAGTALTFSTATFTEDPNGTWLTVSPPSGALSSSGAGKITIQGNLAGTASSVRYGTVQVAFSEGTVRTIEVALVATAPGGSVVGDGGNSYRANLQSGGTNPAGSCKPTLLVPVFQSPQQNGTVLVAEAQTLQVQIVDDCQNQVTKSNGGSAQVTFQNGDPAVDLTDSGGGSWVGTWNPVTPRTGNKLQIVAQGSGTGLAPLLGGRLISVDVLAAATNSAAQPLAALNAASNDVSSAGLVAPGGYVSIYGARLADGSSQAPTTPLPGSLSNTRLLITGQPLPLSFASPGQVNGVIPQNLAVNTSLQLVVQRDTTQSVPVTLTVTDLQPGIFTMSQTGQGQGAVRIANTATIAGPTGPGSAPVTRGGFIEVYCTGLGQVQAAGGTPAPPGDGVASPLTTLFYTVATATATVGGINAPVIFSGLAPGFVSLYQVNVQIPSNAPTGNAVPLVLTLTGKNGAVSSQPVTIAVQ